MTRRSLRPNSLATSSIERVPTAYRSKIRTATSMVSGSTAKTKTGGIRRNPSGARPPGSARRRNFAARLAPGPEGSLRGARPLHPREVLVDEPPVRVHEWNLTGRVATSSGTASPRPASLRRERAGKHPRQPTHRRVVGKRIRGDELPDRSRPLQAHAGKRARRREERPFAVNEAEHWGDRRHRVVEDGAGTATVRGVARRRTQERDAKTRGP